MKKLLLKTVLGVALVFSLNAAAKAQLSVSINIGSQPAWGPSGYNHVDYYYLPDIECYYDVNSGQYIYSNGGRWIFSRALPPRYSGYNLYSGYKVVVNRPRPYLNFSSDRVAYARYKNWHGGHQTIIRETRNVNNRTVINNNVQVNRTVNNGNHYGNNGNHPGNGNNGGRPGNFDNHPQPNNGGQGNPHDDHGHGNFDNHGGGGHDDHGHDDHGHH